MSRTRSPERVQLDKGIELLDERQGDGAVAAKGDTVVYNVRIFLRRGEEVRVDARSIESYRSSLRIRRIDDIEVIDHTTTLGKRRPVAAIEKSLYGMRGGGYREVLASPHLCYGEAGRPGLIPRNAMLRIQIWLREVDPSTRSEP
jgi:FKBP-type peptidyl-prolyl cis-trans isomerase